MRGVSSYEVGHFLSEPQGSRGIIVRICSLMITSGRDVQNGRGLLASQ